MRAILLSDEDDAVDMGVGPSCPKLLEPSGELWQKRERTLKISR